MNNPFDASCQPIRVLLKEKKKMIQQLVKKVDLKLINLLNELILSMPKLNYTKT